MKLNHRGGGCKRFFVPTSQLAERLAQFVLGRLSMRFRSSSAFPPRLLWKVGVDIADWKAVPLRRWLCLAERIRKAATPDLRLRIIASLRSGFAEHRFLVGIVTLFRLDIDRADAVHRRDFAIAIQDIMTVFELADHLISPLRRKRTEPAAVP